VILIIDNYDSFVYNLAQYVGELGWEPVVYRNDKITVADIESMRPSHIIISPGPRTPLEAGNSNEIIRYFSGMIPILGVCLGHQCIGYVYGAEIIRSNNPTHGKKSLIYHDGKTIFKNLPRPIYGGRYHSLIIKNVELIPELEVSAADSDGTIMGIRHKEYNIEGIQFHPESIMTDTGHLIIQNFLMCRSGMRKVI
jgi:para-aminobenzoate synthetase component II